MITLSTNSVSNIVNRQWQPEPPTIDSSSVYEPFFHIVLHQPEIPPNTGAIGRTCVALRAKLWLVRPLGFEITEKSLRRAGLDYWQHLTWEVVDDWDRLRSRAADTNQLAQGHPEQHEQQANQGSQGSAGGNPPSDRSNVKQDPGNPAQRMWMFTKKATIDYREVTMQQGDWLVFGCETSGLPEHLLGEPDRNLRIPTFEQVRSLNLSSAVAVAGYQAATQINLFEAKK